MSLIRYSSTDYWTWIYAWAPIFAYVLISEMSVWMDTEVEGYVKGSG